MSRWTGVKRAVTGAFLLLSLSTCSDSSGDGNESISNPAVFEAQARQAFVPIVVGISDGLSRLVEALNGGQADGVVITPNAGGASVVIQVDFDGNGSREGSIAGGFTGDVSTGAQLTIDSVTGKDASLVASGSLTAIVTAPGVVLLDHFDGSGETDPPGSRNASNVEITDGTVSLDLEAGVPSGFLDLDVSGEEDSMAISVNFEPNGSGGYIVRFTGPGLNFTIP